MGWWLRSGPNNDHNIGYNYALMAFVECFTSGLTNVQFAHHHENGVDGIRYVGDEFLV